MIDHVTPDPIRLDAIANSSDAGPVVMLNLNRYREVANYEAGHPDHGSEISGRDAYLKYGLVALGAIGHVGGSILWAAGADEVVIGCEHDRYDEVVAVWYPSRTAFLGLASYPGYMEAHVHRDAAIEQATLLAIRGEAEPHLSSPF
jgi:hypothetical protein